MGFMHSYFDNKRNEFIHLQTIEEMAMKKFIHIPHQQKILGFGLFLGSKKLVIYECNVYTEDMLFVRSPIKAPIEISSSQTSTNAVLFIYDSLIVLFEKRHFLFFDLLTNEWTKSDALYPIHVIPDQVLDGRDNYVYFINLKRNAFAFKVDWREIIPKKVCKGHKRVICKKLVYGFAREI